ncbi:MAG: AAA family ATPase [Bryobacteraceae bacterium]
MATVTTLPTTARKRKKATAAGEAQAQAEQDTPVEQVSPSLSVLRRLGLVGLERIEPVILAALVHREPLLLVGNHGTGKSLLLNRLAQALGLEHRHYNASLLSFDDLVGYPLPDSNGTLRFVQTPASIWGAQSVFFDEISRCRPEMQNKLFSLIHERRVQGIDLDRLVYRWSAMNPPSGDSEDNAYSGSEPLDLALADRFAFIVRVPDWIEMKSADQELLLHVAQQEPDSDAATQLRSILGAAEPLYGTFCRSLIGPLAAYVRLLGILLAQAKLAISGRRAAMLIRNICAIHAIQTLVYQETPLEEAARLALFHSLPQIATGTSAIQNLKLASAHREAWNALNAADYANLQALMFAKDPLERALVALTLPKLKAADLSTVIADCLVQLPDGAREAFTAWLFEQGHTDRLVASVAEQCASFYARVAAPETVRRTIHPMSQQWAAWRQIIEHVAKRPAADPDTALVKNLLFHFFNEEKITGKEKVNEVLNNWDETRKKLCRGTS